MRKYKIVSILWEDHIRVDRGTMTNDPDGHVFPTLSVGILYKQTKKTFTIISDIEKYTDRDDITYMIIRKPVLALQEYGEIELANLRE